MAAADETAFRTVDRRFMTDSLSTGSERACPPELVAHDAIREGGSIGPVPKCTERINDICLDDFAPKPAASGLEGHR